MNLYYITRVANNSWTLCDSVIAAESPDEAAKMAAAAWPTGAVVAGFICLSFNAG